MNLFTESSIEEAAERLIAQPLRREFAENFQRLILSDEEIYWAQEDTLFDYKLEFPHSGSDSYFAGFVRISLGFYNSFGGVIVVGVHDEARTGGHNKKIVNIERLNSRIRELTGVSIGIKHIKLDGKSPVDLLIVPKRPANIPPVRLKVNLDKYCAGCLWIRRGHEVLEAQSRDIPFLFSPRDSNLLPERILSYLPPSPSTIERFVGRVEILSVLLDWICNKDEPRKFIWGRGGSGKSTVAHEFCQIVRDYGRYIKGYNGNPFDRVVFISAKEQELSTDGGRIRPSAYTDFSDYKGLLSAILISCDYSNDVDFEKKEISELEVMVRDVFRHESILVVVDDIDTLTTKSVDVGFDSLYKLAIRASDTTVKILYTQRNLPVGSESAVQVPGFVAEEEYLEFVQNCCTQFGVSVPNKDYIFGDLKAATECIPLIVETIIRLIKVCGSPARAFDIFMERQGDEARRYLFEREYEALLTDNARHVLCAIAEFGNPVGYREIGAVIRIGDTALVESVAEVLGFFLSTTSSTTGEILYFLNPVTRSFIKQRSRELTFASAIIERVKAFKSAGQAKPKDVVIFEDQLERIHARDGVSAALRFALEVTDVRILENPSYRMKRAILYSNANPCKLTEARDDFTYCIDQKLEDVAGMRAWYLIEKNIGHNIFNQKKVCDLVINGKTYSDNVKFEFRTKKAYSIFIDSKDRPDADAFDMLCESLDLNLLAYNYFLNSGRDINNIDRIVRNTAFSIINRGRKIGYDKQIIKIFRKANQGFGFINAPLLEPLMELMIELKRPVGGADAKRRIDLVGSVRRDFLSGALNFENESQRAKLLAVVSV